MLPCTYSDPPALPFRVLGLQACIVFKWENLKKEGENLVQEEMTNEKLLSREKENLFVSALCLLKCWH